MKFLSPFLDSLSEAVVTFLPVFRRKFFVRPQISIKVVSSHNSTKKKWETQRLSPDNKPLFIYESVWNYQIILENVSCYSAYYPKLKFDRVLPYSSHISVLNHYVPIEPSEKVVLEGNYTVMLQSEEKDITVPVGLPSDMNKLKLLVEYKNEEGTTFYSIHDISHKRTYFSRSAGTEFRLA